MGNFQFWPNFADPCFLGVSGTVSILESASRTRTVGEWAVEKAASVSEEWPIEELPVRQSRQEASSRRAELFAPRLRPW